VCVCVCVCVYNITSIIINFIMITKSTPFQVYEREAGARQLEVGQLRKTGEAHRKRVKLLEQELASQRIIAKVYAENLYAENKAPV